MQLDSRESGNQAASACHIGMPDLQDGEAASYLRGAHHSSAIEERDCHERAGIIEIRSLSMRRESCYDSSGNRELGPYRPAEKGRRGV